MVEMDIIYGIFNRIVVIVQRIYNIYCMSFGGFLPSSNGGFAFHKKHASKIHNQFKSSFK